MKGNTVYLSPLATILVKKAHMEIYLLYLNVVDAQIMVADDTGEKLTCEGTKVSNISENFTENLTLRKS
jgi:hypothetical protein